MFTQFKTVIWNTNENFAKYKIFLLYYIPLINLHVNYSFYNNKLFHIKVILILENRFKFQWVLKTFLTETSLFGLFLWACSLVLIKRWRMFYEPCFTNCFTNCSLPKPPVVIKQWSSHGWIWKTLSSDLLSLSRETVIEIVISPCSLFTTWSLNLNQSDYSFCLFKFIKSSDRI